MRCLACTTVYAPADACPHCGATESVEEWEMAKISRHGGPSVEQGPVVDLMAELKASMPERRPHDDVVQEPVVEETTELAEEVGAELLAEVVPVGTIDEVIGWTEGDQTPPARLLAALDAERARPTSRTTLVAELERRLAQF